MSDKLNAVDLATVSCTPMTPYRLGFEDRRYGRVYWNPFPINDPAFWEYDKGHQDARERRNE